MLQKEYNEFFSEALDMTNTSNVKLVSSFTEADRKQATIILANKLYGMMVHRLEDIDFKEVEQSQGDITRFKQYTRLRECVSTLKGLAKQSGNGIEEVEVISTAIDNLENNKLIFSRGFKLNVSFVKYLYNSIIMAVISDIGFFTTVCVEFIKTPQNTVQMEINNLKRFKTKFYLVHKNLRSFNESVADGDFEKATMPLIKMKSKNFVSAGLLASIPGGSIITLVIAAVIIVKVFLPMLRELSYLFYAFRTSVANYMLLQKKLLEANALRIKNNTDINKDSDAKAIVKRQEAIADFFGKIANFFAIKYIPVQNEVEKKAGEDAHTTLDTNDLDNSDDQSSLF